MSSSPSPLTNPPDRVRVYFGNADQAAWSLQKVNAAYGNTAKVLFYKEADGAYYATRARNRPWFCGRQFLHNYGFAAKPPEYANVEVAAKIAAFFPRNGGKRIQQCMTKWWGIAKRPIATGLFQPAVTRHLESEIDRLQGVLAVYWLNVQEEHADRQLRRPVAFARLRELRAVVRGDCQEGRYSEENISTRRREIAEAQYSFWCECYKLQQKQWPSVADRDVDAMLEARHVPKSSISKLRARGFADQRTIGLLDKWRGNSRDLIALLTAGQMGTPELVEEAASTTMQGRVESRQAALGRPPHRAYPPNAQIVGQSSGNSTTSPAMPLRHEPTIIGASAPPEEPAPPEIPDDSVFPPAYNPDVTPVEQDLNVVTTARVSTGPISDNGGGATAPPAADLGAAQGVPPKSALDRKAIRDRIDKAGRQLAKLDRHKFLTKDNGRKTEVSMILKSLSTWLNLIDEADYSVRQTALEDVEHVERMLQRGQ